MNFFVTFTLDFSLSIPLIEPIFTVIILSNSQYTLDYDYLYGSHTHCVYDAVLYFCIYIFFFLSGSYYSIFTHREKKTHFQDETNRQTGRHTERNIDRENKKSNCHTRELTMAVCVCSVFYFFLLIQCDRVLIRYEINPFVCTLHLQLNINAMVRCTRRIVMCTIGNSLCQKPFLLALL